MTDLLYLPDADDVTSFPATITGATDGYLVLDATYFYPEGGGQPPDHGVIAWDGGRAEIDGARKDHGDVRHEIASLEGDPPEPGTTVDCEIDADRRRRLSRMHTAQHVVSRVVLDEYGAETAGNQVGVDRSRIDFEPADFDDADLDRIETLANDAVDRDLPVTKTERPRARVERAVDEGRAMLELIPDAVDPLRVVAIEGFDMCPCGGTHVDALGEIGRIEILGRTSTGADVERVTFELEA
jgi:misacylated tRNA(Ala) deacylase